MTVFFFKHGHLQQGYSVPKVFTYVEYTIIMSLGEHMTEQELADYVTMMLDGTGDDEFEDEVESSNEALPIEALELKSLEDILPKTVNVENFASNILGFEEI